MKIVYTRPVCPACHTLKAQLTAAGEPFEAVTVYDIHEPTPPGPVMTRAQFRALYPEVRGFPFVVEAEGERPAQQPQAECAMCGGMGYIDGIGNKCGLCDGTGRQPQAEAVQYTRADLDRAYSAGLVEGERLAIQQAEAVPPDVVRDAERWRTFLATRPANTHAVINDAIDAAIAQQKGPQP